MHNTEEVLPQTAIGLSESVSSFGLDDDHTGLSQAFTGLSTKRGDHSSMSIDTSFATDGVVMEIWKWDQISAELLENHSLEHDPEGQ